jgi:hypothetical protein
MKILFSALFTIICFNAAAVTFTVTNTADSGPGSFRDAISQSNATAGYDTIRFNISGAGPHTITPLTALPTLNDIAGVFIDGLSQPGASAGALPPFTASLQIFLNGQSLIMGNGLEIVTSGNTVQGLCIGNFPYDGIRINASNNPTSNNTIYCNFIGTDISGSNAAPNGLIGPGPYAGVYIRPSGTCTGQAFSNYIKHNLISANDGDGVAISSCPPTADVFDNHVEYNYIGTSKSGMSALGNFHAGVYLGEGTHDNVVNDNIISSNIYEGVSIMGYYQSGGPTWFTNTNHVLDNRIGVGKDSLFAMGNQRDGIGIGKWGPSWSLGHAEKNEADNNIIANNGRNGVMVFEHGASTTNADKNKIRRNSIYNNSLLGIDLGDDGITLNDPSDPDSGANEFVNFPVLFNLGWSSGTVYVSGTVNINTSPTAAVVDIFKIQTGTSSGYGQGKVYLGTLVPNSSSQFSGSFSGTYTLGDSLCAVLTDTFGNSSEFSANTELLLIGSTLSSDISEKTLKLYPNPVTDILNVETELKSDTYELIVNDINGRLLIREEKIQNGNGLTLNLEDLVPGLYLLQLKTDQGTVFGKFIKR